MAQEQNGKGVHYYAVVIVNKSVISGGNEPLYEEEIVLLSASSDTEATALGTAYGKAQETSYQNQYEQTVATTFVEVKDVQLMPPVIKSGVTLYSRFFRDMDTYEKFNADANGKLEAA